MNMAKILFQCLLVSIIGLASKAQLTDNFSDGDFTNNPSWQGNTADFMVNGTLQLQSNNQAASSNFYLSTACTKATSAQWDFYCQFSFNTSSSNYADVYLTASASNLTATSTSGYFVRIGSADDDICLYRKDAGLTAVKIIDGVNGATNSSNNVIKIRVVRNAANEWQLLRDFSATGYNFTLEGSATDATYLSSAFFGVWIRQSTSSFFQRHFFDDISVTDYVPDQSAPAIQSTTATSINTADVLFNEPLDLATSQNTSGYLLSNGLGMASTASRDASNNALVHLGFASSFPSRVPLLLKVNGIKDLAGNVIVQDSSRFSYFSARQYDVLIDEIMADPSPVVGLADAEWIELRNTSDLDINLQGWRVGKATGQSGPMPSYLLRKDSFVLVCSSGALGVSSSIAPSISVSGFPSLSNSGDLIYLRSAEGIVVHTVKYSDDWYQNELKKGGGWTLEMTDTRNPCSGISNWKASSDVKGGTPGKKNSADGINADKSNPRLLRAYALDSVNLIVVFNEPVDSTSASIAAKYLINNAIGSVHQATPLSFLYDRVLLRLAAALEPKLIYNITVDAVSDCAGNIISSGNSTRVGRYEKLLPHDLVINEILFNPTSESNDYVELFNRSSKIVNLRYAFIANRNGTGTISSITPISTEDYLLFPQDYIVITENESLVKNSYLAINQDAFIELSMPSYNDDAGNVILLNEQGGIVDEIAYNKNWHFKLIDNDEGVALERLNSNDSTADNPQTFSINEQAANWHSAASNVGYGTPTYKNSQSRIDVNVQGSIHCFPEIISPDNDGLDDYGQVHFRFPEPGYVANITIFDAAGRAVRHLQRNALCGINGYFSWDGLGEKNQQLLSGIYVILTEVFNLQGKTKQFKNVMVLARKY
jgi:hypothetical protein